jgi:hypothetical protein
LLLAIVGLYGLIAFMTIQRRNEIAVRMALGTTRGNILRLITSDGLRMVAIGGALGVGSALAISKMLKALLFEVSTYDPFTFVAIPVLLTLAALVAILMPARAGMRGSSGKLARGVTANRSTGTSADAAVNAMLNIDFRPTRVSGTDLLETRVDDNCAHPHLGCLSAPTLALDRPIFQVHLRFTDQTRVLRP